MIDAILENYATDKHAKVRAWLAGTNAGPSTTPTSASWLNAVEGFFAKLTNRRLKRGVFHSLVELQAAINRYLGPSITGTLRPSSGRPSPKAILAKVKRGHQTLETIHWHDLWRPGRSDGPADSCNSLDGHPELLSEEPCPH